MEYILRLVIQEGTWRRQVQDVLALCARAPVREVMLMEESHQIMTSPFPMEKHRRMAEIYGDVAAALGEGGIRCSINLATCVGHGDNRVPEDLRLPFTKFVGASMEPAQAVYCIADRAWVDYTCGVCKLYAKAVRPVRMMIDDDFRSLNHSQLAGCFCEEHARLTSQRLGYAVTGLELKEAACGRGDRSGEIRAAWMEVNAQAQEYAAAAIGRAIHSVSPETQVGLMNSGEPAHSVQGRNMDRLLKAFADGGKCLSRPMGGAYCDTLYEGLVAMVTGMSLSMAAVHEDTDWVSEVENYPHSPYTKSAAVTKLQMMLHTMAGADALSLNLYDYLATPMVLQPQWERMILEVDGRVQQIEALRRGKRMTGVGLPWCGEMAARMENRSHTPEGILPQRPMDTILPLLGIPVQFAPARTNVLLGDQVLCYSRAQLEKFLSGGLLLDAVAADHIRDRGLGHLLGCQTAETVTGPCVEEITDEKLGGEWTGTLLCTNWEAVSRRGERIVTLIPQDGAQVLCRLLDQERNPIAPSMTLFDNDLGGRISVMSVPVDSFCWLSCGRAALMRSVLGHMPGGAALPILTGGDHIAPFYYTDDRGQGLLGLVNCGLDGETATLPHGMDLKNALDPQDPNPLGIPPVQAKFYTMTTKGRELL